MQTIDLCLISPTNNPYWLGLPFIQTKRTLHLKARSITHPVHISTAQRETVDGIRALSNMGFTLISTTKDYKGDALSMENERAKILQRYKQALEKSYMPEVDFRSLFIAKTLTVLTGKLTGTKSNKAGQL